MNDYLEELRTQVKTLERDLSLARNEADACRRRIALLESDRERAWRMAVWGGGPRRAAGSDHAEG